MNDVAKCFPEPWWRNGRFALVPTWKIRPADEQNTWSCHFHWLVFRAWTMDSSDIGAEVNLCDMQLVVRARIPYLIFGLFIPLFPYWCHQKTWRKSRRHKEIVKREKR